jgi:hypothetical protein
MASIACQCSDIYEAHDLKDRLYNRIEESYEAIKMESVTIAQIEEQLRQLPPEKLVLVFDFVSYLADRQSSSEVYQTALASEAVLRKDWERPEEEAAWANL